MSDTAQPSEPGTSALNPIVQLRHLTMSYGDTSVLHGISLDVAPGQVLGYIGPNGAGKSTTVKILIGVLRGFGGQARVCGYDVATHPLEVKRRIGYVPESAALYEMLTPMEYLRFVGRLYGLDERQIEQRGREMLELFGLSKEADQRIASFSKGMRQKVLITAGMIHNPDVLFLDEPLSGLDANGVVTVKEIIAGLAQRGKTIFYCSHVMDVVERVADRIVIIASGRVIADGTFVELQAQMAAGREGAGGESLERIFTQLTSSGEHEAVASRFLDVIGKS
jgi:ABC-2 type transport system ATP-binding protein